MQYEETLRNLIQKSLLACADEMCKTKHSECEIELKIVNKDLSVSSLKFNRVNIRNVYYCKSLSSLEEVQSIADFMFNNKLFMTVKGNDKNHIVMQYIVHISNLLYYLWDYHSIKNYLKHGAWHSWSISDDLMNEAVEHILFMINNSCDKNKIIIPLVGINIDDGFQFEIIEGVILKSWSIEDKTYYIHKWGEYYTSHGISDLYNSLSYVEIVDCEIYCNGKHKYNDIVKNVMGRIKWAITQLNNYNGYIKELPATKLSLMNAMWTIPMCRDFRMMHFFGEYTFLDEASCFLIKSNINKLDHSIDIFSEISNSLWLLDRALSGIDERDILFDSVVGMERILVNGSGENTKRFKIYGSTLLCKYDHDDVFSNLDKLYKLRSKAAHGSGYDISDFKLYCNLSVKYLSDLIYIIVILVYDNILIRNGKSEPVSASLEKYLQKLLYSAFKKANQRAVLDSCGEGAGSRLES